MAINDALGSRMKENYENIPKTRLMRRTPVAIRIDGKAFHTFTKGFKKPFDEVLSNSMQETMKYLCENVQGCVLGYTQSDEITLILVDYKRLDTSAWFDYEVQKICSVAASMATMAFNRAFVENIIEWGRESFADWDAGGTNNAIYHGIIQLMHAYTRKEYIAMFDARCFNIPKEEVTNLIYWRQLDAIRNSIQMVGQSNFAHKELQGKSCPAIQKMLLEEKGIDWNEFPTKFKRGSCCIKGENGWVIDNEIPIFTGENREYIDNLIQAEE